MKPQFSQVNGLVHPSCQGNILKALTLCWQNKGNEKFISHIQKEKEGYEKENLDNSGYVSERKINVTQGFKQVMRQVPQPVVVVTTALHRRESRTWLRRGITCSSFTSVSVKPPIISFCMNNPSRMHDLLNETKKFAIHVLAKDQIRYGIHFSKPVEGDKDQFENVPYAQNKQGIPIIDGANAVLECVSHQVDLVGDHSVWYGEVMDTLISTNANEPLLYYAKSFRSIGDESFMHAFENRTLPFEDWTHEAHLRMAWNYITEHGKEAAIPLIRLGIKRYNEINKHKISRGYNETITMFYIHMLSDAIKKYIGNENNNLNFDEFIILNPYIKEGNLLFKYYSKEVIASDQAIMEFVPPDLQTLPT